MRTIEQRADLSVRHLHLLADLDSPCHPSPAILAEAQILYEATIRGLADVASGRKLPCEVVKTGCSIDLNEEYFESPQDPSEVDVEDFVSLLMGLKDIEEGRTVPDEVVSTLFDERCRELQKTL